MAGQYGNTTAKLLFHFSAQIIMINITTFKKVGLVACNYVQVLDNDCETTVHLLQSRAGCCTHLIHLCSKHCCNKEQNQFSGKNPILKLSFSEYCRVSSFLGLLLFTLAPDTGRIWITGSVNLFPNIY